MSVFCDVREIRRLVRALKNHFTAAVESLAAGQLFVLSSVRDACALWASEGVSDVQRRDPLPANLQVRRELGPTRAAVAPA